MGVYQYGLSSVYVRMITLAMLGQTSGKETQWATLYAGYLQIFESRLEIMDNWPFMLFFEPWLENKGHCGTRSVTGSYQFLSIN